MAAASSERRGRQLVRERERTEYWKSQARKYCDFCKCWFADNKVSISFHENGKRHKENVAKHISQLTKKSTKDLRQKEKMDDDIKKMEAAAMAAYLRDVHNNADITSKNINEMIAQIGGDDSGPSIAVAEQTTKKSPPVWHEVKSEDGGTYYWNTVTNETTWDPPDEYLSIVDQEKSKMKEQELEKKQDKIKKQQQKEKQKEAIKEVKAHMAREKMRELAVHHDTPPPASTSDYGPAPRAKPYGSWTPVVNKPVEIVDLQLPKSNKVAIPPPVVMGPEVIQFKEKRVQSLGDEPVEFKRRKVNNPKRNMRQKVDDD